MYIDSHAHLFGKDFGKDVHEVISRARDAGVDHIVVPGTDEKTSGEAIELAERYDCVHACVGFHPHDALNASDRLLGEIETMADNQKVVAIGEIGLDYHYDFTLHDKQIAVFKRQVEMAVRKNLPIVVHTRESLKQTIEVIEEVIMDHPQWKSGGELGVHKSNAGRGVFHCFTGSAEEALQLFSKGFFVSYPGIVTFKNSTTAKTLGALGCENILLETDSPYMTPVPLRGRRNEPAYIVHIGRKVSEILSLTEANVAKTTSLNAMNLFGLER